MSLVSVYKCGSRKGNIVKCLDMVKSSLYEMIRAKNSPTLFIKVNTVDVNFPDSITHPDALEIVVRYFYDMFDKIIIGDNSAAFREGGNNPYSALKEKYDKIEFSDLSSHATKKIDFLLVNGEKTEVDVSMLPANAFTISLALPKTHDSVVYTGCAKNMLGCVTSSRSMVHGVKGIKKIFLWNVANSHRIAHLNLVNLLMNVRADFNILDGFTGMEGNGPIFGESIELGVAMCSADAIALDTVASRMLGFTHVPYLHLAGKRGIGMSDIKLIEILYDGFEKWSDIAKKAQPHYLYRFQITTDVGSWPYIDYKLMWNVLKNFTKVKGKIAEQLSGA